MIVSGTASMIRPAGMGEFAEWDPAENQLTEAGPVKTRGAPGSGLVI